MSLDRSRIRGVENWSLGARHASAPSRRARSQLGTIFRRETPFAEPFSGRFRSARPRARPPMSGRARASSPVARRAHDAATTALTLCISAYVLWVLAVRFPLVRRARPRVSRDPETRHPFSRAASPSRTRGSRSGARAVSVTHARSTNHSRGPSLRPSARAVTARTPYPNPISALRFCIIVIILIILIGHRRVDLAPRRARAAAFGRAPRARLPRQPARDRAYSVSARERPKRDRFRRAALVVASQSHVPPVPRALPHPARAARTSRSPGSCMHSSGFVSA